MLIGGIASQALNASLAPRAADLFQRDQLDTLQRLYVASSEWLVRLTLPLLVFLFVCTEPILRLFGPEFAVACAVTRILIIGTLIDAATTQGGIVLNMSGRNAMNMVDTVAALVLNVGLEPRSSSRPRHRRCLPGLGRLAARHRRAAGRPGPPLRRSTPTRCRGGC